MKRSSRTIDADLAIIGTGLAGFAASVFALDRGLSVAQVGNTGAIAYTTDYFDLFGADGTGKLDDPWAGLDAGVHGRGYGERRLEDASR